MKKSRFFPIAFILFLGMALSVSYAKNLDKGYYDYQGVINQHLKIRMSLYFDGQKILGSYYYDKQRQEISVKGSNTANKIVLSEYDNNGHNTGVFEGYLQTVDSIDGFWSTPNGRRNYPFHLGLISTAVGAPYGKRYQDAGAESDAAVESFVNRVQKYLYNNEKRKIATMIRYPAEVKVNGKPMTIRSQDQFLKYYQEIFYPEYRLILINTFPHYLFSNYQGIMLGGDDKNLWVGCAPQGEAESFFIMKINN